MHTPSNVVRNGLPLLLLVTLGFIWGTGYSIARYAMTHGINPLGYSFWQSLGPALLISSYVLATQKNHGIALQHWRYYFICGLTGIALPNTIMYFTASHLPAGLLAVIVNTVPIIAYPLALLAGVETFHWRRLSAVLCAFTGLMLIVLPRSSLPNPDMTYWAAAALCTPLCFAFTSVYISKHRPTGTNSLSLAAGTLIFSTMLLTCLMLNKNQFYLFHLPFAKADIAVLLAIIFSSIGYVLFFQLIKVAGPVYYSFVDSIVTITGLCWGYYLFQETLNYWTAGAVCMILLALLLVTKKS